MSVMSISTVTCRSSSMRTLAVAGRRRLGRIAADMPSPISHWPSFSVPGTRGRWSQPNFSAPFCRQATSVRVEKGTCFSGSSVGSLRSLQLDRVEIELVGQLVHRLLEGELADRVARRAHRIGDRQVERHDAMAW